jgi:endonuclease YncB( thermonuclease family)
MADSQSVGEAVKEMLHKIGPRKSDRTFSLSIDVCLMILHRFAIGLLIVLSMLVGAVAQDRIVGVASVIDGDTIQIHGQRIRLFGIDAPESSQPCARSTGERWRCGQQASFALTNRIGRATVSCQPHDLDRYGRIVAVCFQESEDLNRWMVANGWAVAFRRYSLDYVADEAAVRRSQANIWSGNFDMPWDWRARHQNR